jgi:hypothetical protein
LSENIFKWQLGLGNIRCRSEEELLPAIESETLEAQDERTITAARDPPAEPEAFRLLASQRGLNTKYSAAF